MQQDPIILIRELLQSLVHHEKSILSPLAPSGSDRQYVQISFPESERPPLMAFFNPCVEENLAQIEFTNHFLKLGFRVPKILAYNDDKTIFIIQHLGNQTLFDLVSMRMNKDVVDYYKMALSDLVLIQTQGIKELNMDLAYPAPIFDRQSIHWDLNYFKYCFLKPARIAFNEYLLEKDFQQLADLLRQSKPDFFCYRDFQSRNIMIHQSRPWYIDFQGGRRGPLPYDVVSLLHQVKAQLPEDIKEVLLQHYLNELEKTAPDQVKQVQDNYNSFVYFRLLQVFGAYGFRGLVEQKAHFLQSLPFASDALRYRISNHPLDIRLPELERIFDQIISKFKTSSANNTKSLTVNLSSFSFKKKGPPPDLTGNGGGYIFDCRGLPNPHRIMELRDLTGKDPAIVKYLNEQPASREFLRNVFSLVDLSVDNYLERGFSHLQVNFGCTGGRHRSVFCTEQMKKHLQKKYPQIAVVTKHLEIIDQHED